VLEANTDNKNTASKHDAAADLARRLLQVKGIPVSFTIALPSQLKHIAEDRLPFIEFDLAIAFESRGWAGYLAHHDRHRWRGTHSHSLAVVSDVDELKQVMVAVVRGHLGDVLPEALRRGFGLLPSEAPGAPPHSVIKLTPTLLSNPVRQAARVVTYASTDFGDGGCLLNPAALGYEGAGVLLEVAPDEHVLHLLEHLRVERTHI